MYHIDSWTQNRLPQWCHLAGIQIEVDSRNWLEDRVYRLVKHATFHTCSYLYGVHSSGSASSSSGVLLLLPETLASGSTARYMLSLCCGDWHLVSTSLAGSELDGVVTTGVSVISVNCSKTGKDNSTWATMLEEADDQRGCTGGQWSLRKKRFSLRHSCTDPLCACIRSLLSEDSRLYPDLWMAYGAMQRIMRKAMQVTSACQWYRNTHSQPIQVRYFSVSYMNIDKFNSILQPEYMHKVFVGVNAVPTRQHPDISCRSQCIGPHAPNPTLGVCRVRWDVQFGRGFALYFSPRGWDILPALGLYINILKGAPGLDVGHYQGFMWTWQILKLCPRGGGALVCHFGKSWLANPTYPWGGAVHWLLHVVMLAFGTEPLADQGAYNDSLSWHILSRAGNHWLLQMPAWRLHLGINSFDCHHAAGDGQSTAAFHWLSWCISTCQLTIGGPPSPPHTPGISLTYFN